MNIGVGGKNSLSIISIDLHQVVSTLEIEKTLVSLGIMIRRASTSLTDVLN